MGKYHNLCNKKLALGINPFQLTSASDQTSHDVLAHTQTPEILELYTLNKNVLSFRYWYPGVADLSTKSIFSRLWQSCLSYKPPLDEAHQNRTLLQ